MIICVDFDNVLNDRTGKKFGGALPYAIQAMEELSQEFEVIVFTCVASTKKGREAVEEWLNSNDIEYSEVTAVKPNAELYIDNKGLRHTDWRSTIKEINERLGTSLELG